MKTDVAMTYGLQAALMPVPVSAPGPARDLADAISQRDQLTARLDTLRARIISMRGAGQNIPDNLTLDLLETERTVRAKEEELAKLEAICRDHLQKQGIEQKEQKAKAEAERLEKVAEYADEARKTAQKADQAIASLRDAYADLTEATRNLSLHGGIKTDAWTNNLRGWLREALGAPFTTDQRSLAHLLELQGAWACKGQTITEQLEGRLS